MKLYNLGNNAIMFGDINGCGACKMQDKLLKKRFKSGHYLHRHIGPRTKIAIKINALPTWYIPTGNGHGYLREGVIDGNGKIKLKNLLEKKTKRGKLKQFSFGDSNYEVDTLKKYGRNFPDGQDFKIPDSFSNEIQQKWKDPLLSGTLGREFGPGNTDKIYSNNYFNEIRMARPGGDLDTTLNLNRSCNTILPSPSGSKPILNNPGMIYNSPNPQISQFGKKKKNRFGQGLYQQMGQTPIKNYLLNTTDYSGGRQNEPTKPYKIDNPNLFINTSPVYNPLKSNNFFTNFGKVRLVKPRNKVKKEKRMIKPGDTISISKGKIRVSRG